VVTTNDLADPIGAEPIDAIPVETTGGNPVATAIAWIAVVVAVVLIGSWVWTRWIDPPVGGTIDRYVKGTTSVEFADPVTAQFRVAMPTKFQVTQGTNEWGAIVTVSDNPGGGYEFSATKTPQPTTALDSYQEALNRLAGQLASERGAEIVSQTKPVPLVDVAFKEVVFRKGSTYWHAQLELLKDRLYTVVMKAPNDDDAPFVRLTKSFQILGPL
jgi:hypothetical protein